MTSRSAQLRQGMRDGLILVYALLVFVPIGLVLMLLSRRTARGWILWHDRHVPPPPLFR